MGVTRTAEITPDYKKLANRQFFSFHTHLPPPQPYQFILSTMLPGWPAFLTIPYPLSVPFPADRRHLSLP
jgi:hypothetical protein